MSDDKTGSQAIVGTLSAKQSADITPSCVLEK